MAMKNILLALALGGVLAGCASNAQRGGVQAQDLRKSTQLRMERIFADMDFPKLQRNLFQHRAACGSAPRFVMHQGETSYASLIETADLPDSYENVVLADLTQYPESLRATERVAFRFYSYYYNNDIQQRIDRMLSAVLNPGSCEPLKN